MAQGLSHSGHRMKFDKIEQVSREDCTHGADN